MAVLPEESASFRERVVSFRSDPDRFLTRLRLRPTRLVMIDTVHSE
jgi:hypothetical protein